LRKKVLGLHIVTWVALVLFVACLGLFVHGLRLAYQLIGYERGTGVILHSALTEEETCGRAPDSCSRAYVLRENVLYQYTVAGVAYQGTAVQRLIMSKVIPSAELDALRRRDGEKLHPRFRAGATVDVWYDPTRPRLAVLDRTVDWGVIGILALFLVLTAVPAATLTYLEFQERKRQG
jgi:hypothetical protein